MSDTAAPWSYSPCKYCGHPIYFNVMAIHEAQCLYNPQRTTETDSPIGLVRELAERRVRQTDPGPYIRATDIGDRALVLVSSRDGGSAAPSGVVNPPLKFGDALGWLRDTTVHVTTLGEVRYQGVLKEIGSDVIGLSNDAENIEWIRLEAVSSIRGA